MVAFFKDIRVDKHAGLSASSLRKLLNDMEKHLVEFQQHCELQAAGQSRQSILAMDEVFLGEMLTLVMMDLPSGYLLLEEASSDRTFETWWHKADGRLQTLGINVKHAVSDRAKALIKLAVDGFGCVSGADIFHAQYDVSRWLGSRLGRLQKQAKTVYEKADAAFRQDLDNAEKMLTAIDANTEAQKIQQACDDYHQNLMGVSDEIHPFSLQNHQAQRREQVLAGLEKRAQAFEKTAKSQTITDSKNTMKKFRNQFEALAANVEFWWLWMLEMVPGLTPDEATQHWLLYRLLPAVYWHQQARRTKNPAQRKQYQQAGEQALARLEQDEFTS